MGRAVTPTIDEPGAELFVRHYFAAGFDAREAVLRAGLTDGPVKASRLAARLMADDLVQAALRAELERLLGSASVQAERVLAEYQAIAFALFEDYAEVYSIEDETRVQMLTPDRWPVGAGRAVKKIKVVDRYSKDGDRLSSTFELELHDKLAALRALGEYLNLFVQLSANLNVNVDAAAGEEGLRSKLGEMLTRRRGRPALGPVKRGNGANAP